jgi:hypothetical protein
MQEGSPLRKGKQSMCHCLPWVTSLVLSRESSHMCHIGMDVHLWYKLYHRIQHQFGGLVAVSRTFIKLVWNLTCQCSCCTSDLMGFHCLHLGLQKQQTYPTIAWFSWYVSKLCHTVFSLVSFVSLGYNITNWTWILSTLEMVYESMDTFAPQGEWKCFTMSPWAKLCSFREWEHVSHLALCPVKL